VAGASSAASPADRKARLWRAAPSYAGAKAKRLFGGAAFQPRRIDRSGIAAGKPLPQQKRWQELLIDILKLTDEVKRLNREVERVQDHVVAVDKRVVRLETMVEMAASAKLIR
jgi:hypothetical protein